MTKFKDYRFDQSLVTVTATDGNYVWIAFTAVDGVCLLKKVNGRDLSQVYFSIPLSVEAITNLFVLDDNIYACVTDVTYVLYALDTSSPFTSQSAYTKAEFGITEDFITGCVNATDLYLLTPGDDSMTNAQIVNIDDGGTLVETIDLSGDETINNANSVTIDDNDDIWVTIEGDPTIIYRVYYESSQWKITEPNIT